MGWSKSQSDWSSSVKVQSDLWHLKAENAGGWNDDGPKWEEITSEWVWFCLAFIATEENDGKVMVLEICLLCFEVILVALFISEKPRRCDARTEEGGPIYVQCCWWCVTVIMQSSLILNRCSLNGINSSKSTWELRFAIWATVVILCLSRA